MAIDEIIVHELNPKIEGWQLFDLDKQIKIRFTLLMDWHHILGWPGGHRRGQGKGQRSWRAREANDNRSVYSLARNLLVLLVQNTDPIHQNPIDVNSDLQSTASNSLLSGSLFSERLMVE